MAVAQPTIHRMNEEKNLRKEKAIFGAYFQLTGEKSVCSATSETEFDCLFGGDWSRQHSSSTII